jgi:uncharacterized Zn-binding protein involved in type VI secretion
MAAGTRLTDYCTGHDACAPTPLVESSPDVFINGRGVGRVGDHYATHGCDAHAPHQDNIAVGSATVFANDKPVGRIGDAVVLAGSVRDGSSNVFVGG